jgi:glucose/arabinose dehydrogenase
MHLRQGLLAALIAAVSLALAATAADAAKWRYVSRQITKIRDADYITTPPTGRGRLFVVIRNGVVRIMDRHGKLRARPFLDQRDITLANYQRGLLSIVFAPDYAKSGRLYVHYVLPNDTVQIDELRRSASDPNRVDPTTRRHLINVGKGSIFHHGGQLAFGPDGMLYISTGVADNPTSGQHHDDLHGKILRIDPRPSGSLPYTVPPDNPHALTADGYRPEIWASGLRNPWRFSFDPVTGDLAIGDVGENTYEEVDFVPFADAAGANFGFDYFEGFHRLRAGPVPEGYVPPVIEHKHNPFCAVMGGYVVRDRSLHGLYGKYLYGDLCLGDLRVATLRPGRAIRDHAIPHFFVAGPISFGQDAQRHLYAIAVEGEIYRLRAIPAHKSYRPSRRRRITGPSA